MQNEAKIITLSNDAKSEIDKNPGRYEILGGLPDASITDPQKIYDKDPEAYYPHPPAEENNYNPNYKRMDITKKSRRKEIYELDQVPYYSPTPQTRIINQPEINGKETPITMGDVTETFPTEANLLKLKNRRKQALEIERKLEKDHGVYKLDPRAYYDPTIEESLNTIKGLDKRIAIMEKSLDDSLRNDVALELKKTRVKPQIQNYVNMNAENTHNFVIDNYYTPIELHRKKKYHLELPVGTRVNGISKPYNEIVSDIVDADEDEHEYLDADEISEKELVDADETENLQLNNQINNNLRVNKRTKSRNNRQ